MSLDHSISYDFESIRNIVLFNYGWNTIEIDDRTTSTHNSRRRGGKSLWLETRNGWVVEGVENRVG